MTSWHSSRVRAACRRWASRCTRTQCRLSISKTLAARIGWRSQRACDRYSLVQRSRPGQSARWSLVPDGLLSFGSVRLVFVALLFLGTACGSFARQPLGQVEALPPALSPELRDQRNRLDIHYHLNAPASVTSEIVAADGRHFSIAREAPRPTPGDYVLQFDGTVAGPGKNERRVLPDGDYQVVLEVAGSADHQQVPVPLTIRGADTQIPEITDLALIPDRISPNYDAPDDVTHMAQP